MAAHALRIFRELNRDLLDIEQRQPRVVQQRLTCRCQRHAFGEALEQRDAESELEIVHPLGDRGRRDALTIGGAGEVLFLADRNEQPQRGEIDPARQRGFGWRYGALRVGVEGIGGHELGFALYQLVIARSISDEAIQTASAETSLDCFASLAMTANPPPWPPAYRAGAS